MYSLLRYPGGKSRAIKEIIKYFPSDLKRLCSPFFGGGSIEFYLASIGVDVYGYDIFAPLITFWKCVDKYKDELVNEIYNLYPMSKYKFKKLQTDLLNIKDPVKQAATFYALNRSSFSGTTLSGGMSPKAPRFNINSIERIKKFNTYNVKFNTMDFKESIKLHKDDFLYLDPPYYIESNLYGNKGDIHKKFDHEGLAAILKNRTSWILSYNNCDYIRELYKGYHMEYPKWTYGMSNYKTSKELLIVNY